MLDGIQHFLYGRFDDKRNAILRATSCDLGLEPGEGFLTFGFLMDIGCPNGTISAYAYANGYMGKLACGKKGQLRQDFSCYAGVYASDIVAYCSKFQSKMRPAQPLPRPENGIIQFHALTDSGQYCASVEWDSIANGYSDYTPLYQIGFDMLKSIEQKDTRWFSV